MSEPLLSMADIARLAGVERPVVSMWRQRPKARGQVLPFPEPTPGGDLRFPASEVLDWLDASGRGNNPEARLDLARQLVAQQRDHGAGVELECLLALRALSPDLDLPSMTNGLLDLADELDADDESLFSELASSERDLPPLAALVNDLWSASLGAHDAVQAVYADGAQAGSRRLTQPAADFLANIAWRGLALGRSEVSLVGLESADRLACSLLTAIPEGVAVSVVTHDRYLKRLLTILDIPAVKAPGPNAAIRLAITLDVDPSHGLGMIDDAQLDLRPADIALAVAPASVITDRLDNSALQRHRDDLLRVGHLRHLIRLPAGLLTSAPRQSLALWIMTPNQSSPRAEGSSALVSDMTGADLSPASTERLIGDVVAGLSSAPIASSHAYAVSRPVSMVHLLATNEALVRPGVRPHRLGETMSMSAAADVLAVQRLLAHLAQPTSGRFRDVVAEVAAPTDSRSAPGVGWISVADLVTSGALTTHAGVRLDLSQTSDGATEVICSDDVLGARGREVRGSGSIDPLDLEAQAPRARRCERGDIVFVTAPRPAAAVCREGAAVVTFPARILRCHDARLIPEAVAATINALPATDKRWRGWQLPVVDGGQASGIQALLQAIEDERSDLAARHTDLDQLTALMTTGAARGTLAITIEGEH